jgi:hypothetical protein
MRLIRPVSGRVALWSQARHRMTLIGLDSEMLYDWADSLICSDR